MKRMFATLILVIVAGCTQEPVVVVPAAVYRDQSAQIASQTNVSADRMVGEWAIRQRFAVSRTPTGAMSLAALPNGGLQLSILNENCRDDVCADEEVLILLDQTGPGRWTPRGPQSALPAEELWVMWMDFDTRTAAIGTPSGEFGWIMDKNPTGGRDRITAARDIMDWFGYNMQRLEEVVR